MQSAGIIERQVESDSATWGIYSSVNNSTVLVPTHENIVIGKQRALSLDILPIPTIGSVKGYCCV